MIFAQVFTDITWAGAKIENLGIRQANKTKHEIFFQI